MRFSLSYESSLIELGHVAKETYICHHKKVLKKYCRILSSKGATRAWDTRGQDLGTQQERGYLSFLNGFEEESDELSANFFVNWGQLEKIGKHKGRRRS